MLCDLGLPYLNLALELPDDTLPNQVDCVGPLPRV